MRLVNNAKDFLKYSNKPIYITHKIFGKDYAAIHEIKPVLILNKPTYVGFTVLDWVNGRCMISINILLKIILMLNYCLQTKTVLLMK